jgi:HEAT repeat protein
MKLSESSRIRVGTSITLMVCVYAAALYWVYRKSAGASDPLARLVPLATSLAVVPLILVVILATLSVFAKSLRYVSRTRDARISPEIRETLASAAVGDGDRERLRWLSERHRRPFEVVFTEFLSSFGGETNSTLRILAVELGLAERWHRDTRSRNFLVQKTAIANLGLIGQAIDPRLLDNPLEQTRIEAACALLASNCPGAPALVFPMLPEQSPLGRIRLAEGLRPFASEICERYLADGIRSSDIRRAKACVDLLRAWELWIPIANFAQLIAGRDLDLRLAALPALHYASATGDEAAEEVFALLSCPDERLHAPAARAAAHLGLAASLPLLLDQLRKGGPQSAFAAAQALADLGPEGKDVLEREILSSDRPQYALHALEQSLVTERG